MGCISSKLLATVDQEIFSAEDARASAAAGDCPNHVVSLTSTTYGVLSLDRDEADQAKKKELKREEEHPHPPEQQHQMLVGVGAMEEEKVEAVAEEEGEKEVVKRECKRSPPPALVVPPPPPPHTPFSKKRTAAAAGARDEPSEVIDARELMEDLSDDTPFWSPLKKPHIKPHQHLLMRLSPASRAISTPKKQQQQQSKKKSSLLGKENTPVQQDSMKKRSTMTDPGPNRILRPFSSWDNVRTPAAAPPRKKSIPSSISGIKKFERDSGSSAGSRRSLSPLFDPDFIASLEREHCEEGEQIKKMVASMPASRKARDSVLLLQSYADMCPPGGECAVVLYTTTLRGIRKTFEDCNAVRSAIEAYDVQIVERDISMDSGYREELRTLVGKKDVKVPFAFVKGRLIGGAEEILMLEEEGILGLLLEGIPRATNWCDGCAGVRFMMCTKCNGSRKVLDEAHKKMIKCEECNENGLIHCPICC